MRRIREADAKSTCPGCGKDRLLNVDTGRCKLCSHRCAVCNGPLRLRHSTLCRACRRKAAAQAAKSPCPRCGRPGLLREATGWCGPCSRPAPPKQPPRICAACGQLRRHSGLGMCSRCWQRNPDRPYVAVNNLIGSLADPPAWLPDFAAHVAEPLSVSRACGLISKLGRLLTDGGPTHPQALLERARRPGRSIGSLARILQDFFTTRALALPTDQATRLAATRRQRRIDAGPDPLRPAVAGFADALLQARERARRAGTRPRTDGTIDNHLGTVRDLARHIADQRGKADWATVDIGDVEAFLTTLPAMRKSRLTALRQFFRYARNRRLLLIDPTTSLTARDPWGFRGKTVDQPTQRRLFRRWTTGADVHPHEALVGLLALLHGASSQEARLLTVDDIDHDKQTVQLGRRPLNTALDPATWAALRRCLTHRDEQHTANPHLIVTRGTKTSSGPASSAYLTNVLYAAGVVPKHLRSTRLLDLAGNLDPKLVAAAFGMDPEAVLPYLVDRIDPTRMANL